MSRMQEILARAERDGTATRTFVPAPAAAAVPTPVHTAAPFPRDTAPAAPTLPATDGAVRRVAVTLGPALVAAVTPQTAVAERYRALRSRLAEGAHAARTLLVTSPGPGDGRSVTAANLALTMALERQRHIVLVDADLRHPAVHDLFGLERGPGLADVLEGTVSLEAALVYAPEVGLTLLPAGRATDFPTELLGSPAMRRTLDALRARFDRVVLDAPPALPLADVSVVAPLADGTLVVVRAGATQRPALDRALDSLEPHRVLGIVLNAAS